MPSRSSKVVFIFTLYLALHFAQACDDVCDCSAVLPHFDYKALNVTAETPTTNLLRLLIEADSVEYLAAAPKHRHFNVMSAAWACRCASDGYDGPKNNLVSLNVYADRAFNDTLPAGASLNPVFFQLGGDVLVPMADPDYRPYDFWLLGSEIRTLSISTSEKPTDLSVPYRFRVEAVKSTGDTLRAETGDVYFQ